MIDLHLHTTASDGRSSPEALVAEAAAAGVTTLAVTDHDTVQAVPAVRDAAERAGLTTIAGIEITAIHDGRDIHVLGYGVDAADPDLLAFLSTQRQARRDRVVSILKRLEALGLPIDASSIMTAAIFDAGRAVGRPMVARALVAAGHVRDVAAAFDRYLAEGRPAYVPRVGPSPAEVSDRIVRAGGVSSLAHPAKLDDYSLVRALVAGGLEAIEVYHPDHNDESVARYRALAEAEGLVVTGGSDYHGPGSGREGGLGRIGLPPDDYARLVDRAAANAGRRRPQ
ncbi:MAG: PHP domain-containing protein [Vicinamibacterales bacterium]